MKSVDALYDRRSEPNVREVLADVELESGARPTRLGVALQIAIVVDVDVVDVVDVDVDVDDPEKIQRLNDILSGELNMRNGLTLVQIPGARYGYSVSRVGHLRRVAGDEWELVEGRTLTRTSGNRRLSEVVNDGPKDDHKLGVPDKKPEPIHRLLVRRVKPLDEAVWTMVPKPKGWIEE